MALSPFVVGVNVTLSGVAQGSVNVTLRNDSTNETLTKTTNSSGEAVFDLGNLDSGWTVGDVISVFTIYTNYEASSFFTSTDTGGTTLTLALTAVPDSASLRYITVQDVYDFYNLESTDVDAENGIKPTQIVRMGVGVEKEIDELTNTRYDSGNTVTQEYHDGRRTDAFDENIFFTEFRPVQSITTLQTTQNSEDTNDSETTWNTLVEADDFFVDLETGRLAITSSAGLPNDGRNRLRVTYTYGFSSVPEDIKRLALLMVGRTMMTRTIGRQIMRGRDFSPTFMTTNETAINSEIAKILRARERVIIKTTR